MKRIVAGQEPHAPDTILLSRAQRNWLLYYRTEDLPLSLVLRLSIFFQYPNNRRQ